MFENALIAWLLIPVVAGLQRFCTQYGYAGRDKGECIREALNVTLMVAGVEVVVLLYWLSRN